MKLILPLLASVEASELFFGANEKPYPQNTIDEKNLLKYLGNFGPYTDRRGYGINRDPPAGCKVDQVIMLGRHGERWPTAKAYKTTEKTLQKIKNNAGYLTGSLEFANYWQPFAESDDSWLQEESLYGPYAGLLDAYYHGAQYRRRYGHLYDGMTPLPLFVSAYQRDYDTARKFGEGFLQWNYTDLAAVNFVLEENGADTLAPFCQLKNSSNVRDTLCPKFEVYDELNLAADRLNNQIQSSRNLSLTGSDIVNLMTLVAYELNVRGSSPWASVFTSEEWIAFNYFITSSVYCKTGPGSVAGPIEGSLFLNASRQLLMQGPKKSNLPIALSFAHDSNIMQLVSALGLDEPKNRSDWDPTRPQFGQRFSLTEIVPQGARIVFERLSCNNDIIEPSYANAYPDAFNSSSFVNHSGSSAPNCSNSTASFLSNYVRVVLNEAVVPLDGCSSGPGYSCPLSSYNKLVDDRMDGNNFTQECVLKEDDPTELTFFWNFTNSTQYNTADKYEPAQATTLDLEGKPVSKHKAKHIKQ